MRILFNTVFLLGLLTSVWAQHTVTGVISDQNGEPIPSVTITVLTHTEGTITDINGKYKISVPDDYSILVFDYPGSKTQDVHIGTQTIIDLTMSVKSDQIENATTEDVGLNIGIGSTTKRQNTGNVSQVSGEDIRDNPVSNLESSMQGRTAGVMVKSTGVQVRGSASLTASNDPLYVVDGVPLVSDNQSNINPANIKSMEILKDASAAAIYGSRAANGVIVITTHSGSSGKMKIDADYQIGISETPKYLELYSSNDFNQQFLEGILRQTLNPDITRNDLAIWAQTLESGSPIVLSGKNVPVEIPLLASLNNDTDWQDRAFRTALSHRAALSLQGGSEKLGYFISTVYNSQEGILIGRNSENINLLVSLNSQINSKLSARMSINFINDKQDRLREDQDLGAPLQALALPPSDTPDANNNGYLSVFSLLYNPETEIFNSTNQGLSTGVIGSLGLTYDVNEQLSIDATFGIDVNNYEDILVLEGATQGGGGTFQGLGTGRSQYGESNLSNYLINGWATYKPPVNEKKSLSIILGSSYEQSTGDFSFRVADVISLSELNALNDEDARDNPIQGSASAFVATYSRVNYSINDRYLFQVSARYDGSSKFPENNRFGTFYGISGGWIMSEEAFIGDGIFKFLKLKASYGVIGNTPLSDFGYQKNYQVIRYEDDTGFKQLNPANLNLKWESTGQLDIGLEYSLGARVSGAFDYYLKSTSDLLFPVAVSPSSVFSSQIKNGGSMKNSGVEISLNTLNVDLPDWKWSTDFNITFSQNKITSLNGNKPTILGSNTFSEGFPASSFFLRKYAGVNPDNGNALYYFRPTPDDPNDPEDPTEAEQIAEAEAFLNTSLFGDEYITENWEKADRRIVGNPNPGYFGGITNNISYKNISLTFMFQFVGDVDRYFATGEFLANSGILGLSQLKSQADRWYNVDEVGSYPRLDPDQTDTRASTRWLEDGSYTRLTNVILSYKLPQVIAEKMGLNRAEVYIGGQNLWTITGYTGYDPDVVYEDPSTGVLGQNLNKGVDNFTAPQPRIFTTGIKIGL